MEIGVELERFEFLADRLSPDPVRVDHVLGRPHNAPAAVRLRCGRHDDDAHLAVYDAPDVYDDVNNSNDEGFSVYTRLFLQSKTAYNEKLVYKT